MQTKIDINVIKNKLHYLTDIVCAEAQKNPEFLQKLADLFSICTQESTKINKNTKNTKTPGINVLEVLHNFGETAIREKLGLCTNDELLQIATKESIKRGKSFGREELISKIIEIAQARLKQGESFTKL